MPAGQYHRLRHQLQAMLSPARMAHSLGVMATARAMAPRMGADAAQAELAGLVHDIAKELPPREMSRLADEARIVCHQPCERHPIYLHAPVGAFLADRYLGVRDVAILEAIAVHSYGGPTPRLEDPLAWVLRLADLTEPNRRFDAADSLRWAWACKGWRYAAWLACTNLERYLTRIGAPCHPNVVAVTREMGLRQATPGFLAPSPLPR
jgi:predicted HD superfamily hydrolase involved in NAD metabolism